MSGIASDVCSRHILYCEYVKVSIPFGKIKLFHLYVDSTGRHRPILRDFYLQIELQVNILPLAVRYSLFN